MGRAGREQNLTPNSANTDLTGQGIPVFQGDTGPGYVLSSPRTVILKR